MASSQRMVVRRYQQIAAELPFVSLCLTISCFGEGRRLSLSVVGSIHIASFDVGLQSGIDANTHGYVCHSDRLPYRPHLMR